MNEQEYIWNDIKVNYRKTLPLEVKKNLASIMVTAVLGMDESSLALLKAPDYRFRWTMMLLEAYTDIDIPITEEERMTMYDEMEASGIDYLEPVRRDVEEVLEMEAMYEQNARAVNRAQNGMEGKLLKMFGSILDGKDVAEAMGHAEEMVDLVRSGLSSPARVTGGNNVLQFPAGVMKKNIEE